MKTTEELFDLRGKVALVTGGSRGIGRAVSEGFASAGADVVIASRKLDNCEAAAREIEAATGRRAVPFECHVGRWQDCDRLFEAVYRELGRCDVLVNNAGMSPAYDSLTSVTEDLYDKVHATCPGAVPFERSVRGTHGTRKTAGRSSTFRRLARGAQPPPICPMRWPRRPSTRGALGLAGAWAPKVRANLVLPSACDTDLTMNWPTETKSRIAGMNPMGRMGTPEDLVGVCVFLASDAASYVNGAQVPVDGGLYRTL